jgi:hypothetical protein
MTTTSQTSTTRTIPTKDCKTGRRQWPEGVLWQGIGIKRFGGSYSSITNLLEVPKSTLAHPISRYEKTGQVRPTIRYEKSKITTARDDRQLFI